MARRGLVHRALIGGDLSLDRAGIALAEEKLGQGKRRAEPLENTVIDADGRAAMTADDDLRLRRRDKQGAHAGENDQISAAAERPLTAKLKASRKAEIH
jgi:hypothetical protein